MRVEPKGAIALKSTVSVRTAVVLLLAVLASVVAGLLTYWSGTNLPVAFLAGGSAFAVVFPLADSVVGDA
ncbi:hypothetical protein GCM10010415_65100 [Streptomyces atrovirens]|uniref:Uncharacterized protein n=1 Tax=Streptomyces atrovirens TaxID=285556 RepID=A0ABW0DPJ3_9ACTN